jgi:hypothetical protein
MALKIMLGVVGGAFAFTANMLALAIIDQINQKVPEGERVDWIRWGGIRKKHRKLYPESRLVLAMDICGALMVLAFIAAIWLTGR